VSDTFPTPPPRSTYIWSVFTKPWSGLPGDELGKLVAGLGFTGAEIPVRDTAYVTPATAETALPKFVQQLRAQGVRERFRRLRGGRRTDDPDHGADWL
jgi:hypothetical protein